MPHIADTDLIKLFESEEIGGVSVDTSIFDQYDCNLSYSFLRRLDQFKETEVQVLFSDVIEGEVCSHLSKALSELALKVKTGLNQFAKKWNLAPQDRDNASALIGFERDARKEAQSLWDDFAKSVAAENIICEKYCKLDEIMTSYFLEAPPFKNTGEKKHEFPDAFALRSLEGWARDKKTKVIVVTRDNGWKEYADASNFLIAIHSLQALYGLFNSKAQIVAEKSLPALLRNHDKELTEGVTGMIQASFDYLDYEVEASSPLQYEIVQTDAHVGAIKFGSWVSMLSTSDDEISFAIIVTAEITVNAEFSFYAGDRDSAVDVGSNDLTRSFEEDFELVLTIPRDPKKIGELVDWEVTTRKFVARFGEVYPDYLE